MGRRNDHRPMIEARISYNGSWAIYLLLAVCVIAMVVLASGWHPF